MAPKDINTMAPNLKRDITTGPSLLLYYYRVCQLKIEDTKNSPFLKVSISTETKKYYGQTFSIIPYSFVQKLCGL